MTIQVFEHQRLVLNDVFREHHLNAMSRFNGLHGNKYFKIIHHGVQFTQYVGVLQIGELTIEILPKVDKFAKGDSEKWRTILLEMLQSTSSLKIETLSKAPLLTRQHSLLEIYLWVFLNEVKKLLRQGLVKEYENTSGQQKTLKGQLQFQHHLTKNIVHKERFYTLRQTYTTNHLLHQIITSALQIIQRTTTHPTISSQTHQLLQQLPIVAPLGIQPNLFSKVHLDRKTAHYQSVIDLAQLILMNYCPDLKSGHFDILAILLDMNQLFERYIFTSLRKVARPQNLTIQGQPIRSFWENKTSLRPDIFLQTENANYILDTKWKMLMRNTPESDDLKQMYAYGNYFQAATSILVYPKTAQSPNTQKGVFHQKMYDNQINKMVEQRCDLLFVDVLKNGKLNHQVGKEILEELSS